MAENLDCVASNLLCHESTNTSLDDLDFNASNDVFWGILSWLHKYHQDRSQHPNLDNNGSLMGLLLQTEERIVKMVGKERDLLPKDDYLKRLRDGHLDMRVRREALDWIWKAYAHHKFGPVTFCLSVNYFDRFLSVHEFPSEKAWIVQLLAVACLSLAGKLEEPEMPQLVDLQVGEPKFVFEAKTIQRMELLVLNTLKWRLQACTPCSFIDYFLTKSNDDQLPSTASIFRAVQLILSTIKGIDFLEFKPSEIAAAVAIFVSGDMQAQGIDNAISHIHVQKEMVIKCVELIKDSPWMNGSANVAIASTAPYVADRPDGVVLDSACLSYEIEDITVESCASSAHSVITSDTKKRKTRETTMLSGTGHENRHTPKSKQFG
uniref:Cyclin D2-2 n=1 Tax=Dimocarpus longan TaxID=128017 RepID=A0A8G0QXA2_9ROSI|nr:cyclin D2-2 [Dimocarpus longan]